MATLQIKKKSDKTWEHIDSELGTFIVSKFYFSADSGKFQIVEQGQSKRRIYDVTDIEVFDIGGSAETFVNITQLSLRLEELSYVGFSYETLIVEGVEEAPIDGTTYGRKDAGWVDVASTTDHESLLNLQGGTTGEHYHLTAAQYAALGTASGIVTAVTKFNTGTSCGTEGTWFGMRATSNTFETNTLTSIALTGSPLDVADWRGEVIPLVGAKVDSAYVVFQINTATLATGVECYLLRKDYTDGSPTITNLEVISQTSDTRSMVGGNYYKVTLTINSHTVFVDTTLLYFAIRKRTGGGATGLVRNAYLVVNYKKP